MSVASRGSCSMSGSAWPSSSRRTTRCAVVSTVCCASSSLTGGAATNCGPSSPSTQTPSSKRTNSAAAYKAASKRIGTITKAADHYEYDGLIASTVKIFERVDGARLLGTAAPGSTVEAHLPLLCGSDGRLVRYARTAVGGADGRFELVVAHPTEGVDESSACRASSSYQIYTRPSSQAEPTRVRTIPVDEHHVRTGGQIDLGRLF